MKADPVQPKQYDPTRALNGKVLTGYTFVPELGDWAREVEFEEPMGKSLLHTAENPDPKSWDVIQESVQNERNSNKVRRKQLAYPRRNKGVEEYPVVTEELWQAEDLQEFLDLAVVTTQIERKGGTLADEDLAGLYRAELSQYGPRHNVKKLYRPSGNFLTLVHCDTDPTTGLRVRVTRSVVTSVPSPEVVPPGSSVEYKQIGQGKWIRTERTLMQADGVTPVTGVAPFLTVNYYTRVNFTFPAYIKPFDPAFDLIRTLNKNQRRTIVDLRIRTRREFTANTEARKTISYHAAPPTSSMISNVFEYRTVDWRHDGALFRVNIDRVIANETLIHVTTLINDTFYGAFFETVTFPASSPITTDLLQAQIGSWTIVDIDVQQIENRIWRMTKTSVIME